MEDALPYARLSEMVYQSDSAATKVDGWVREGEPARVTRRVRLDSLAEDGSLLDPGRLSSPEGGAFRRREIEADIGFKAATYTHGDRVAIVFEGSVPLTLKNAVKDPDWSTNVLQWVVIPEQYKAADAYVQDALRKHAGKEIVITGHSLGGGLAQYTAGRHGVKAYTFNPARLGVRAQRDIQDGSRIVNFVNGKDVVPKAGKWLARTKLVGEVRTVPRHGKQKGDSHSITQLRRDLQLSVGAAKADLQREAARRRAGDTGLKREALREFDRERRIERRMERFFALDRASELQLSKSVIDAHGQRVRMDAYVRRPSPERVEHWILNFRAHRFDYAAVQRTFAQPLRSLSEVLPFETAAWRGFDAPPANYIVSRVDVASNGTDRIQWTMSFTAPVFTNNPWGGPYLPGSWDSRMRVTGPGYDRVKNEFSWTNNLNDYRYVSRFPDAGGALATYVDDTRDRGTFACISCSTNDAAAPSYEFNPDFSKTTIRYKDGTFSSFEFWTLRDDGTRLPSTIFRTGAHINFEQRWRASEFQGRDIDVVYPSPFFFSESSEEPSPP